MCACDRDTFTVCPEHTGYTDSVPAEFASDLADEYADERAVAITDPDPEPIPFPDGYPGSSR